MEDKIRRICQSLGEFTYDIDVNTLSQDIEKAENDKQSAKNVITNSKITFREYLQLANKKGQADVSVFKVYNLFVARQRSISIHLNMLKEGPSSEGQKSSLFNGLAWAPKAYDFFT
jgi:hypothetical protein